MVVLCKRTVSLDLFSSAKEGWRLAGLILKFVMVTFQFQGSGQLLNSPELFRNVLTFSSYVRLLPYIHGNNPI